LEVMFERVAGLDVHKKSVTVTVRAPDPDRAGRRLEKTRQFSTYYERLLDLARWLVEMGVTHAAMESTGVYWFPVWQALREVGGPALTIEVVNAAHVKAVPGRKTDVKDSQWLAQLLEVGLLRGSFIPPQEVRRLRDLTRYRTKLIEERSREKQRLLKTLEQGGIKLDSVASDTFGVSGRLMLKALVAGERDPVVLADMAKGRMRIKIDDLRLALAGRFTDHHADMVSLHLSRIEGLEQTLDELSRRIGTCLVPAKQDGPANGEPPRATGLLKPFATQMTLLTSIPGVGDKVAAVIISEIGVDMSRFPTPAHLAAWAGLAPGNNESGGRRRRAGRRKGNPHLAAIMVEAASAAAKTQTRIGARFRRLHHRFGGTARRGKHKTVDPGWKRAAFATAHTMIKVVHRVLASGISYQDLGADFYERAVDPQTRARNLVRLLEGITGKRVALVEQEAAGDPVAA
jgi:transposase